MSSIPLGFCGCGCGQKTKSAPRTVTARGWVKGRPLRFINGHNKPRKKSLAQRFWSKVNKNGPMRPTLGTRCWLWTGHQDENGYGRIWSDGSKHATHVSWFVKHGTWPEHDMLHRCDNPPCVNPDHLRDGTAKENVNDAVSKGRHIRGSRVHTHKLVSQDVKALLKDWNKRDLNGVRVFTQKTLAEKYGITPVSVSQIVLGRHWKHIPR